MTHADTVLDWMAQALDGHSPMPEYLLRFVGTEPLGFLGLTTTLDVNPQACSREIRTHMYEHATQERQDALDALRHTGNLTVYACHGGFVLLRQEFVASPCCVLGVAGNPEMAREFIAPRMQAEIRHVLSAESLRLLPGEHIQVAFAEGALTGHERLDLHTRIPPSEDLDLLTDAGGLFLWRFAHVAVLASDYRVLLTMTVPAQEP